ncbi:MAG TPA: hypothetical protein VJQ46_09440 [Gemmatimonadales bacterium]|nr:hypothetical protein [Gemmatimonadales bacterium]
MARSARDFSRKHPSADAGYGPVVDRLDATIARMETLASQQQGGYLTRHSSAMRRQLLRRRIRVLLQHLVTVAADAADEVPALLMLFRLPPSNATNATHQALSRKLLEQARASQELLVKHGLTATLVEDLAAALEEFDRSLTETADGTQDHVLARAELDQLSDEVSRLVGILDGINRYRFEREPEKLIAWLSARHVVTGPQPDAKDENPAASSGPVQAGPGEVQPAA